MISVKDIKDRMLGQWVMIFGTNPHVFVLLRGQMVLLEEKAYFLSLSFGNGSLLGHCIVM